MNQFELLRHITSNFDETLKEAFEKRMFLSSPLVESKLELGLDIYDKQHEIDYIKGIVAQFPPELSLKANSLWASLTRMSRSQQYRYLLKNKDGITLAHEPFLSTEPLPENAKTVAPELIAVDAAMSLDYEVTPCHSLQGALDCVIKGDDDRAIVACQRIYDADSIYLSFYNTCLFVNSITRSKNGAMLFELSKSLIYAKGDNIMTLAFAVDNTYGSMVQTLSMLSEAKLNIEHMRLRRSTAGLEHPDNLVFIDLSGDFSTLETKTALYQMEQELAFFRLLGFWNNSESF